MSILRKFLRFLGPRNAAPKGLLSRMKWILDRHSDFLENIRGEDGVEVRRNYEGGITISSEYDSGSYWSGIVFANGQPIKDFNRIGNDPEEANSEFGLYGMDGDVYAGSVTGEWLKVDRATGDCDFMDSDDEELFDDASDHEYFKVAERSGKDENGDWIYFPVSLRTCGDAHVFKGGASGSYWSGIVWFGGEIKWDFNRVDNDPQGELSKFGMYGMDGGNYAGSVRGEILKINRNSGSYRWGNFSDEGIFDDINVYEYFPVADQSGRDGIGAQIYVPLAGRTCGDVHLYTNPMLASLFIESATYEEDGESYNVTVSIKGGTWVHRMLASADIKDRDLVISMPVDGDFFCYVYIEGLYEDNLFQAQFGYSSEYPVNASDSLRRCLGKVTLVGAGDPDSYILLERRWAGGDIYTW